MDIFQELRDKYNANIAHTFIFYGNTYDYIDKNSTFKQSLIKMLTDNGKKQIHIIFYDRADGITFPRSSDMNAFKAAAEEILKDKHFGEIPSDPAGCFDILSKVLKSSIAGKEGAESFALIVDYAESVVPAGEMGALSEADRNAIVTVLKLAKDSPATFKAGNMIIMITSALSKIHSSLREPSSRIETIGVPYPDTQERAEFVKEITAGYKKNSKPLVFDKNFDLGFMSRTTAGLAKIHIMDIIQRAMLKKEPISLDLVRERKNDIIKAEFEDVLQITEPENGFDDIGGYDYVKQFFGKNIINAIRSGDKRLIPMGVLLMGPAGCGKTIFAKALAKECGVNFVTWKISRLFNRWVGSTEENTEKAIWAIKSLRPVIVFVDELDTAVSRDSVGDSNVSSRVMKALLEFMSDTSHRGEIIFVAATNRPGHIDFALKRTGRLDKKIPILPPNTEEAVSIYGKLFARHKIDHSLDDQKIREIISAGTEDDSWHGVNRYVGSDIEAVVLKSYELAAERKAQTVEEADLKEALALIEPSIQDIQKLVDEALRECNDKSLLPEEYRKHKSHNCKTSAGVEETNTDTFERKL